MPIVHPDSFGATAYAGGKVLAAVEDQIGRITFNQPEKHNAMSVDMWEAMADILAEFTHRADVRAVILTGAGNKAFVSGADISQFDQNRASADAQRDYDRHTGGARQKLAEFPKPVIARIRGYCLGGGLSIALLADLRIASSDSSFSIPAAKLGLGYSMDMVRTLVDLVGPAHARHILYTGQRFDAGEAMRIGLVNTVVSPEMLNDTVMDVAQNIVENAPLTVTAAKLSVGQLLEDPRNRDMDAVNRAIDACFNSQDYREGRAAFREKRMPHFKGQ
jgi:enoyl-CoA hydratase/carnithine racemase